MAEKTGGSGSDVGIFIIIFCILVAGLATGSGFAGSLQNKSSENQNSESSSQNLSSTEKVQQEKDSARLKSIGTLSPLSKYFSLRTGRVSNNNPNQEYLELNLSSNAPNKVLITGFNIKSGITGRGTAIGKAVYKPYSSLENLEEPIFLSPGDKVYIVSGKSPVGYSFRVNKCSGFFGQAQNYTPSLYNECPLPTEEILPNFGANNRNACLNYLERLGRCQIPNPDFQTSLEIGSDCVSYVTNEIGYGACVDNHGSDNDFYRHEWRVHLKQPETLWQSQRELIKLVDQNGQTVAYTEY